MIDVMTASPKSTQFLRLKKNFLQSATRRKQISNSRTRVTTSSDTSITFSASLNGNNSVRTDKITSRSTHGR